MEFNVSTFWIIYFLTIALSVFIVTRSSVKLNKFSIASMSFYTIMIFGYLGYPIVFLTKDRYYVALGITDMKIITNMFVYTSLVIIQYFLGFYIVRKIQQILVIKNNIISKKLREFFNKIKGFIVKDYSKIVWAILFVISIIILIKYLRMLDSIALFEALRGSSADIIAESRSLMTNDFPGYSRYRQVFEVVLPILSLFAFANLINKKRSWIPFYIISFLVTLFALLMNGQKAPSIWFLLMHLGMFFLNFDIELKLKNTIFLIPIIIFLLLFSYILFMDAKFNFNSVYSLLRRAFAGQIYTVYYYFLAVPSLIGFQLGKTFPNPRGIFPFVHFSFDMEIAKMFSSSENVVSSFPAPFWGELWVNFGWYGLILIPLIFGALVFSLHSFLENRNKTIFSLVIITWISFEIKELAFLGFSRFLVPVGIVILLLIAFLLYFSSNNQRTELIHEEKKKLKKVDSFILLLIAISIIIALIFIPQKTNNHHETYAKDLFGDNRMKYESFYAEYDGLEFVEKDLKSVLINIDRNDKQLILNFADLIMDDYIVISSEWDPVLIEDRNWDENPFNNSSWELYYLSLIMVPYLTTAYEISDNVDYLIKAEEILIDWIDKNKTDEVIKSALTWNDHVSSDRAKNMIHFLSLYIHSPAFEESKYRLIVYSIYEHGLFLSNNSNYTTTNHGIMQDQALIEIAVLFDNMRWSEDWYEIGMSRLIESAKRDITVEGVHKEHSPAYHNFVKKLIQRLNDFLSSQLINEPEISSVVDTMEEYSKQIVTPSGFYPQIGSTHKTSTMLSNEYPSLKNKVYKESGYGFLRENSEIKQEQLYLMFVAAYNSHTHKHKDDLSFVLSLGLTDYFVDSGFYSFESTKERRYLTGPYAHNTVILNNSIWQYDEQKFGGTKIIDFSIQDEYSYITAEHNLYSEGTLKRTIIHLNPGYIIIHDEVPENTEIESIQQIFNIGKDVEIEQLKNGDYKLFSRIENTFMELSSSQNTDFNRHYFGNHDPYIGWQSYRYGSIHPINTIIFQFERSNAPSEVYSVITVNKKNDIKSIEYENGIYKISKADEMIYISREMK